MTDVSVESHTALSFTLEDGSLPTALSLSLCPSQRLSASFRILCSRWLLGIRMSHFFFFFPFPFFFLFPLSSLSGSSGGKHSYSVPDQQSRAWQDSSTVDQEIRHIDGGPLTPRPRSTHPTPPPRPFFPASLCPPLLPTLFSTAAPVSITHRSVKIQERQLYNVQQIFIAFTIRTSV